MSKNKKGEPATKKFVIEAIRKYHATEIRRQLEEDNQESIYTSARMIIALENLSEKFAVLGTPSLRGLFLMLSLNFVLWILFLWWIEQILSQHGLS